MKDELIENRFDEMFLHQCGIRHLPPEAKAARLAPVTRPRSNWTTSLVVAGWLMACVFLIVITK
jgi:hypothetical protein